jgi:hypothetical protein
VAGRVVVGGNNLETCRGTVITLGLDLETALYIAEYYGIVAVVFAMCFAG